MFRPHFSALTLLAAFTLPLAASAQTAPGPQPAGPALSAPAMHAHGAHRHHRRNPYLHALRKLNLTDAQRQQIAGYMKAQREARVASARALRRQIDGVLTPDQRTQLHASLNRPHGAPGAHGAGPNAPAE